jgi:hypothetical protein
MFSLSIHILEIGLKKQTVNILTYFSSVSTSESLVAITGGGDIS